MFQPDPLPPDLRAALPLIQTVAPALQIHYAESVTSTNDVAAALADGGAPESVLIVADMQTAGRGRRGRTWFSPPGAGLYVSTFVRSRGADSVWLLTLAAGVAAADAVRAATGLAATIKWPNDIVSGRRKIGGILAEGSAAASALEVVVLGIGLNVRTARFPRELAERASSLETELGKRVDRGHVLVELVRALGRQRDDLRAGRYDAILGRWRELAPSSRGAPVEWTGASGTVRGVTEGIGDDGALLVRTPGGIERIISGEVKWL